MPTYEYICEKCGHHFDHYQSIKDEPLKVCAKEKCHLKKWGKGRVKRAIGAGAGLIFKGSGFYITDYRSENYKQSAKKESGGGESKPGTETKTSSPDTKSTGAKTETKSITPKKGST